MSATPNTMKAIIFDSFGDEAVLKTSTVEVPQPKQGEVLIKLSHTSVNPVDWKIRKGYLKDMLPHVFPIIPGWDASGTIVKLGEGVTAFAINDAVAAYTRLPEVHNGTYAEYISLPVNFVAKVGANVPSEQAAGVPLVALTALQALNDYSKISKGQNVLILNGAGGVGSFAIQFAKQMGANVTTTTSHKNFDYVKSLGADQVIDYTKEEVLSAAKKIAPQGFNFVFDAIGGEGLNAAFDLVKKSGQIVSIVDSPSAEKAKEKAVKATFHFVYPNGAQLQSVFDGIAEGKTKIPAYTVRPVTEAAGAQLESEQHHTRGKTILKIQF